MAQSIETSVDSELVLLTIRVYDAWQFVSLVKAGALRYGRSLTPAFRNVFKYMFIVFCECTKVFFVFI